MKLLRIAGQSPGDLRRFYSPSQGWGPGWHQPIEAMLALVTHLEETVDFPPQWVCTSHEDLVFTGDDNNYRDWRVGVHPIDGREGAPARAKYEVRYPAKAPWSHVIGYAEDVTGAARMIISALEMGGTRGGDGE